MPAVILGTVQMSGVQLDGDTQFRLVLQYFRRPAEWLEPLDSFLITMSKVTVIVCTRNPRECAMDAVLAALRAQTLPLTIWELVVVDNQSHPPVRESLDLGWHPNAQVVVELQPGLTRARLRGIEEAAGPVLVFVDDDNVLAADYLEHVLRISGEHTALGAWGGRVDLKFDEPPPEWTSQYWGLLAHREVEFDQTCSDPGQIQRVPVGAGLCIRREVGLAYANLVRSSPLRMNLDRRGSDFGSCGDTDLALTACDLGMGFGQFKVLHLHHLIPASRLTVDHLAGLSEGVTFSSLILRSTRDPEFELPRTGLCWHLRYLWTWVSKYGKRRHFHFATKRAHRRARKLLCQ